MQPYGIFSSGTDDVDDCSLVGNEKVYYGNTKMGIKVGKHLPRNGQYELFIFNNIVHCFDDLLLTEFKISPDDFGKMLGWLQDRIDEGCRRCEDHVWYLTPNMYLLWKLRWAR